MVTKQDLRQIDGENDKGLKRNLITRDGFTLIELIVATAMTVIVIFGIAIVLVNSQ